MNRELKVIEFNKKQKLVDYVNSKSGNIEIVSISSCQMGTEYGHFLWYYEK